MPRWKRNMGRDFVFYHPHPGFVSGNAGHVHDKMFCFDIKNSTHLVVELPQVLLMLQTLLACLVSCQASGRC